LSPHLEKGFWDPEVLQQQIHTTTLGQKLFTFNRITSTNEFLKRLARRGAAAGTVIVADEQTSGRGRLGRRWHSPPGKGLWFSFLMRPPLALEKIGLISLAVATVVAETLSQIGEVECSVKWPNDVLIAGKKVCGILCETQITPASVISIVAGVGLNVNQQYEDLALDWRAHATSLLLVSGKIWDRQTLFVKLLNALDQEIFGDLPAHLGALMERWCSRCPALGQMVTVVPAPRAHGENSTTGVFAGLGENGELMLRMPAGNLRFFSAGEITLAK